MFDLIKKTLGKNDCCGVEIKEVEDSCCEQGSKDNACCSTEETTCC